MSLVLCEDPVELLVMWKHLRLLEYFAFCIHTYDGCKTISDDSTCPLFFIVLLPNLCFVLFGRNFFIFAPHALLENHT